MRSGMTLIRKELLLEWQSQREKNEEEVNDSQVYALVLTAPQ